MSRRAPVSPSQELDLSIERLAHGGAGVARHENFVVFVKGGLPGDTVRARIGKVRRSFAEARAIGVVTAGEDRRDAPCGFHGRCGGCGLQSLDYPAQLRAKQEIVRELLGRIGHVQDLSIVREIVAADAELGYRNKLEYSFGSDEEGLAVLGFHESGAWDRIVGVEPCLLADDAGRSAHVTVLNWARQHGIPAHDRATGEGMLRNLVVRIGRGTGEVMVHLISATKRVPKMLELADDLHSEVDGLVSVLTTATESERPLPTDVTKVLWGRDWYEERMGGVRLKVGAAAFLQTNTSMADRLYELVAELGEPRSDDVVHDLYCGIGSIGLSLAGRVKHVYGIEVSDEAIECARENAALNGIGNATFFSGNVRPLLKFLKPPELDDPTLVVVDPPRAGLAKKVIMRTCERAPQRIVYVSCNPATFASDLLVFAEHGYAPTAVQPVDMFPHTPHVELVARLEPI